MSAENESSENPHVWIESALGELDSAELLFNTQHPRRLDIIGRLCHLCAEKAIKGVYLSLKLPNLSYPRIHNLPQLLSMIKNYVKVDEAMMRRGAYLTIFKTHMTYPLDNPDINDDTIKRGLDYAKLIYKWAYEIVYNKNNILSKEISRIKTTG